MSQEIAIFQDGFNVPERSGANLIAGDIIKFVDGIYRQNKTEILTAPIRRVAIRVITAWVHWENNQPTEHRITQPGQLHPDRDDLPDQDKAVWPIGIGGLSSDPWRNTRYLKLVDPRTGSVSTFVTDSTGGRIAIGRLKEAISNVRCAEPHAVPLIELDTVPMKTKYGTKPRPDFRIIEWRNRGTPGAQPQLAKADSKEGALFDDEIPWK
jgi:hypothetical protein